MKIVIDEEFENIDHLIVNLKIITDVIGGGTLTGKYIKFKVFGDD